MLRVRFAQLLPAATEVQIGMHHHTAHRCYVHRPGAKDVPVEVDGCRGIRNGQERSQRGQPVRDAAGQLTLRVIREAPA